MTKLVVCMVSLGCFLFAAAALAEERPSTTDVTHPQASSQLPAPEQPPPLETPRFDRAKYDGYVARIVFGSLLLAGGAASMVLSFVFAIGASVGDWSCPEEGCSDATREDQRRDRAGAWVSLSTWVTGIAVGIPLVVTGAKGSKRQRLLRAPEETLAGSQGTSFSASLFVGESSGALLVAVSF